MRFRLSLVVTEQLQAILPINYQYPISAWIYKTINYGNHEFANFLHQKGFGTAGKAYKFFTFSHLMIPRKGMMITGDRIILKTKQLSLEVSFLAPEVMQHFISGLFSNQTFRLGDKKSVVSFRVEQVEAIPMPEFKPVMEYKCLSPVIISTKTAESRYAQYLAPGRAEYESLFVNNLENKVRVAIHHGLIEPGKQNDIHPTFKLIGEAHSKNITIKADTPNESQIRGYLYNFQMQAPQLWHRIGYLGGFGEKNSLGMGCVGEGGARIL